MSAGTYNLFIDQTATFTRIFVWTAGPGSPGAVPNSAPPVGSAPSPVDLTGYTAVLQIKPFPGAPTIFYDASSNITLGGTAGTIELQIPAASTAAFTWFNAVYDLLLTDSSGISTRLLQGTVTVSPAVSP